MKAAIFHGIRDIKVEEVEKPKIMENEILVKVKACGICGSDLHMYKLGLFKEALIKPYNKGGIPGHEYSGEVVEVGSKVTGISIDERIIAISNGGMAEFVAVTPSVTPGVPPGSTVLKIPEGVSYEEAATLEPLANSYHATMLSNPIEGENAVIFGMGAIGLGIIQCLKSLNKGVNKIIAVDLSDNRLKIAKQLGADEIINARNGDPVPKIIELTGMVPMMQTQWPTPLVEIVYDCVGYIKEFAGTPVLQQAINVLRHSQGRVIVHGLFEEDLTLNLTLLVAKQITIKGSFGFDPVSLNESIQLMETKKIDRSKIISHEFPLDQVKEAFETACKPEESVKVLIKP